MYIRLPSPFRNAAARDICMLAQINVCLRENFLQVANANKRKGKENNCVGIERSPQRRDCLLISHFKKNTFCFSNKKNKLAS